MSETFENGVHVRIDDRGVGWIEIDRPERRNALNGPASKAIVDTLNDWSADDGVRVVVLSGRGGSFSTGADVVDILGQSSSNGSGDGLDPDQARSVIAGGSILAQAVRAIRVPVVALVDGPAAGIGASLAFAADLIVATQRSYFLLAFINIGLMPDGGATMSVAASVGRARANALAMLGEKLSATAALDAGLISEVVADADALAARAADVIDKLLATAPLALQLTKSAIDAHTLAGFDAAIERELAGQTELLQSDAFQAAIVTFAGKR